MKIRVLKITAKGEFVITFIPPHTDALRKELGGAVDTINLFTDVQSFIRRTSEKHDLEENVYVPGIYGDIVMTGGSGSYFAGLSEDKIKLLIRLFKGEESSDGKA